MGVRMSQRVLIAEDEVLIGLVLDDMLAEIGCTVVVNAESLTSATAAFDRLGPGGFDVAVLDVHLGEDSVFPLADRIADAGGRLVFSTGSHRDELPDRFRHCPVLQKPYTFAAVKAVLAGVAAAA